MDLSVEYLSMDVLTLFFLSMSLVIPHIECRSTGISHRICPEPWRIIRSTNNVGFEVSFTNKTLPGNYAFLLWSWNTKNGNTWQTSLWSSSQKEKLQGSAVLRTSDKVLVASIIWQLHNSTLEWAYSGNEILNEFNWTVSLCQITDWSFTSKLDGKWTFQFGDLKLDQPFGRKIIVLDNPFEKQLEFINLRKQNIPDFDNNRIPDYKKYLRLRRSRVDKENFSHSNATPAEKWEIVQAVLDRVFGNSEDIRRNGWVSHLNIFNILGRIFGLDQLFNRSPLAPTTTEANSATEPDAETVNTNFLRRFPGARIKS